MEKKAAQRSVQGSSKGLATESKKNQDVVGKPWPKGGRRREPSNGTFPLKSEASRKPQPQKNKTLDKRPRTRGLYCPGPAAGGKESAQVDETDEPELGSVFVPGSKKQSLNHLLKFHYAPRDQRQNHHAPAGKGGHGQRWVTTSKHRYNKEHFIQANCQFIVNSSGDYKQYMNNVDALVDWSLIEQVNVQVHELPSCPICLYPPVAAKMTRCGHIYCWPCVLHYLALSEKTWQKCPICYESIHRQDLKSVVPIPHCSFNVNEIITFKLMKRVRGSLTAYPIDEHIKDDQTIFNMSDKQAANVYCKLLLADKNDVMSIITREKLELQAELVVDNPENPFIEQAVDLLLEREHVITEAVAGDVAVLEEEMGKVGLNERERYESFCSDYIGSEDGKDESQAESSCSSAAPTAKVFYFYQAADGQHIYLHNINVRMLEHTYGTLEFSPKQITGRIVEKEGGSMTEDLRKRFRYLQHLPVTCQFEVAEIHLHPPAVNKETMEVFAEQLEIRKKRRQRRSREEKRREKRIAEEENRQMGKFPDAKIELESHQQFPEFGEELTVKENAISGSTSRSSSPISLRNYSDDSTTPKGVEHSGPSFAKMLVSAKKNRTVWPEIKSTPSPRLINVTGSKTEPFKIRKQSDSEPENEDYVPAPEFNRSFGDAIAMALEKASKSDAKGINGDGKSGKKKKKNKQKVLFATSMACSGN